MATTDFADLVEFGDMDGVRRALAEKPELVEQLTDSGDYPLHLAAHHGRIEMVAMFLDKGADVNAIGCENMTPLQNAIGTNYAAVVRLLIDRGADVTIADKYGRSPMTRAALEWVSADASEAEEQIFTMLRAAGAPYDLAAASLMCDLERVKEILDGEPGAASEIPERVVSYVLPGFLIRDWANIDTRMQILELLLRSGLPLPVRAVRKTIDGSRSMGAEITGLVDLIKRYARID